jgi:hypothetical protein
MTLNAEITMMALQGLRHNNNAAPFRMGLPNLPTMTLPLQPKKVFRSKKWCIVCGWRKNQHTLEEGVLADATRKETANARATTVGIAISYSKNIPTMELEWVRIVLCRRTSSVLLMCRIGGIKVCYTAFILTNTDRPTMATYSQTKRLKQSSLQWER